MACRSSEGDRDIGITADELGVAATEEQQVGAVQRESDTTCRYKTYNFQLVTVFRNFQF